MSHRHDRCCYQTGFGGYGGYSYGAGYPGYGAAYGGVGYGGTGCGVYGGWGIRWIYALLVLIVIVLQFGKRRELPLVTTTTACDDGVVVSPVTKGVFDGQLIDNSVLFIIVVFLLILCSGCWGGGFGNYGAAGGYGYGY